MMTDDHAIKVLLYISACMLGYQWVFLSSSIQDLEYCRSLSRLLSALLFLFFSIDCLCIGPVG